MITLKASPVADRTALPIYQIQTNKLPNKSNKWSEILFQIKQIQNPRFEMQFDIFDTQYSEVAWQVLAVACEMLAYPEPASLFMY